MVDLRRWKMGRLTYNYDYCFSTCYEQEGDLYGEECPWYKRCYERQIFEKLKHYEDLEEQGYKMANIDKVVEQLEDIKMRHFLTMANTGDDNLDFAYEYVGNALDTAIEIVRGGAE